MSASTLGCTLHSELMEFFDCASHWRVDPRRFGMSRKLLLLIALVLMAPFVFAADSPRFRGPESSGVFVESGLLQSWPKEGPHLLWSVDGLGESYASVSTAEGRLYTTGMANEKGTVYAFDLTGKPLWETEYGAEHKGNGYPGTRTTSTVAGNRLFLLSALGKAVALNATTGSVLWQVDLFERFKGENLYFGISESPLVVDGNVIFTPGSPDATVVALDAQTGETVWASRGLEDAAAYCTPVLFDNGKHRQILTMVEEHIIGLDPETGEILWSEPSSVEWKIHATSPVIKGNSFYVTHGYDQGGKLYELAADGRSVQEKWSDDKLDVQLGGAVWVDGHIYGAASKKTWYSLAATTGEVVASIPRLGKAAVVYADGRLYGYAESGKVFLVDPDPANFKVVGSFKITQGSGQHWSHPVVSNGVLYIRHGDVLMAFDVKLPS